MYAQHLDLPGAEREARVPGVAAGEGVGPGRDAERKRVGAHVPAVGEQRHRTEQSAGGDFDHHHGEREPHHLARATLRDRIVQVVDVDVDVVRVETVRHVRRRRWGRGSISCGLEGACQARPDRRSEP
jgi:hypothetical protein